jgi:tRNA threonylcarbamoyl adenosine modification protein (Sua5/YciO/YrdC/YwlC family)
MSNRLRVHPVSPQQRLIDRAADVIRHGGLLLCPTDAGYAFAWGVDARDAEARVVRLRALDTAHPFTLLCRSLSEAGHLARIDDQAFRLIRSRTPGPCTFILPAASGLPRRLKQAKRRAVGIRIPDHPAAMALMETVGEPLLTTSLVLPDTDADDLPSHEAETVADTLLRHVDLMIDAEDCPPGPTSVIDFTNGPPELLREGFRPIELD